MQRYLNDSQAFLSAEFDNRHLQNVEKGCESMGLHYEQVSTVSNRTTMWFTYPLLTSGVWIFIAYNLGFTSEFKFFRVVLPLKGFVRKSVCVAMF